MGLPQVEGPRVRGLALAGTLLALAPASAIAAESFLVVLVGLGGDEAHRATFHDWAGRLTSVAVDANGLSEERVYYLGEDPEMASAGMYAKATKENVIALFDDELRARVRPGDQIFVVLFGHGSFRDEQSRFNLPGPDLTAEDFSLFLKPFSEQQIIFVNTTSASGGFAPVLTAPNCIVVTSTKSGNERNESQFGKYFVEAYAGDGADTDKNERVSIWEAFEHARIRVDGYYSEENLLKTEHALLTDEAETARTVYLMGSAAVAEGFTEADVADDPELARLVEDKLALEGRVEALKLQKSTMPEALYLEELEQLLIQLATVTAGIEARRPTP